MMDKFPVNLNKKLNDRILNNSFRSLNVQPSGEDFYSNDYLGFSSNKNIATNVSNYLATTINANGSTGSRLISGTHNLHIEVEKQLAKFYHAESSLLFNSGYDANLGLFSAILQKNDIILYDELIHASVRDGIRLSNAISYKFKHNNILDLEAKILLCKQKTDQLYIAIETIYSMDGDMAPLQAICNLCAKYNVLLIVDEAHSSGVFGDSGRGLISKLMLNTFVFARVHTFGKALGCHGAVVLGSLQLKNYLINFSRPFIYTTAIPLHTVATIKYSFLELEKTDQIHVLKSKIIFFNRKIIELGISHFFIKSTSSIHCCLIKGNENVKKMAKLFSENNFSVKAVLSPTVPKDKERLRICLHSFNTDDAIVSFLALLKKNMNKLLY